MVGKNPYVLTEEEKKGNRMKQTNQIKAAYRVWGGIKTIGELGMKWLKTPWKKFTNLVIFVKIANEQQRAKWSTALWSLLHKAENESYPQFRASSE